MKNLHKIVGYLAGKFALAGLSLMLVFMPQVLFATLSVGPYNPGSFSTVPRIGSVSTWSNVSNVANSDSVFAINTSDLPLSLNYTDYLVVKNFGFNLPEEAIITGINVDVQRNDGHSKGKDAAVRILKNNSIGILDKSLSLSWGATNDYFSYGGVSDLWGETWSPGTINSPDFGFAISAQRFGGGLTATTLFIDHIQITVYYNMPGGLPVGLLSFIAAWKDHSAKLNWTTASEINNDYFTLEKSQDMEDFKEVCRMKGAGNSQFNMSYAVIDSSPFEGAGGAPQPNPAIFYRLKQTDFDGNFKYLAIARLSSLTEEQIETISVYPNPVRGPVNLAFNNYEGQAAIKFTDEKGNVVYSTKLTIDRKENISRIEDTEKFLPGLYYLSIKTGDEEKVSRVVKLE